MSNTNTKLDEKYRPRVFSDLIGNKEIIQELKEKVDSKNIPHLLLSGPAGTGKTSSAGVIVSALYKGVIKNKYKEINASDDNGIEVIRTTVKKFAANSGIQKDVEFRIIILDECDEMTPKAQAALRRIMERYYKHCRFILLCNYEWKIIKPLKSRCSWYKMSKITAEEMIPRLTTICKNENINIKPEAIKYVAEKCEGDMRTALNSYIEKIRYKNKEITLDIIKSVEVESKVAETIVRACLNQHYTQARQFIYSALQKGQDLRQLLIQITKSSDECVKFSDAMKGDIAFACLECDALLVNGSAEELVIGGIVSRLMRIGQNY